MADGSVKLFLSVLENPLQDFLGSALRMIQFTRSTYWRIS